MMLDDVFLDHCSAIPSKIYEIYYESNVHDYLNVWVLWTSGAPLSGTAFFFAVCIEFCVSENSHAWSLVLQRYGLAAVQLLFTLSVHRQDDGHSQVDGSTWAGEGSWEDSVCDRLTNDGTAGTSRTATAEPAGTSAEMAGEVSWLQHGYVCRGLSPSSRFPKCKTCRNSLSLMKPFRGLAQPSAKTCTHCRSSCGWFREITVTCLPSSTPPVIDKTRLNVINVT